MTDTSTNLPPQISEANAERSKTAKATINKHNSILFQIKVQDATGKAVPVYELANKTIGFLCSAGRFAVCQEFGDIVDKFVADHPNFVIVYVSLDLSEGAFNKTLEAHPSWLAIPYNHPVRMSLLEEWQARGVPVLHIYDPVDHVIVTSWGGSCLRFNYDGCFQDWKQGYQGITYWQIVKGWWYAKPPPNNHRDLSDEELARDGFVPLPTESQKDK